METNYGSNTGKYPVLDALYTLAFAYPRTGDPAKVDRENSREAFFRGELAQLFALGKETGLDITTLTGSYAGAMGWGQFMPSSYRDYAVDGDGDGKRDLFNSTRRRLRLDRQLLRQEGRLGARRPGHACAPTAPSTRRT